MSNRNEIKSLAKLAKQRLKSGFWEECRENVNESLTRAKEEGENTSNVIRYYKSEVARVISNKNEELELFYVKVKNILDEYGDISNIIGVLCDVEYMKTLTFQQRERYLSDIAAKYRICKERYDGEKKFSLKGKQR